MNQDNSIIIKNISKLLDAGLVEVEIEGRTFVRSRMEISKEEFIQSVIDTINNCNDYEQL